MKRASGAFLALLAMLAAGHATGQAGYPVKPVRFIVNFATGGPSDIVARIVAANLGRYWGQPVIVENVAGFAGNIGAERVAKAPADGYTLLISGSSPIVINPSLYSKLPLDPVRDLAPVTQICTIPNLLVIYPSLPAKSFQEFVALAKGRPGEFTFASSGSGSASHLGGELLRVRAGIDIRHVPYRGAGAMIPDLQSGRVTMTVAPMATLLPLVNEGKLRAVALASAKRSPALPDLPTIAESGYAGFDTSSWQGAFVPRVTPPALVLKLSQDIARVLAMPEVRTRFAELGMEPVGNTPQEIAGVIEHDLRKWAGVIRDSDAKPDQ